MARRVGWASRTLEALAPGLALARAEKRARLEQLRTVTDLYRAASWDRSFSDWNPLGSDANAEIGYQLARLRNRARDLGRNNPYVSRGYSVICAKLIGKGVRPRLAGDVGGQIRTRTLDAWQRWVETCDPDGQQDLYGLQLLAVRTMVESGEALVQFIPTPDLSPIPWQIRILEPDMIDISRHGETAENGNHIIHGVEFNARGDRTAYYLFDEHPGTSMVMTRGGIDTRRVPADFIAPLYRQDRPDQVHGVPWIASSAPLAQHLDDLMDTFLKKEKIQACFAAFVQTNNRLQARGEAGIPNYSGLTRTEQISPAMIDYLGPDESITFANPPSATNSGDYHKMVLHAIACGLGVTYAQLTGDLSNNSYSSARIGGLDQWSLLDQWQNLLLRPMLLNPLWQRFEMVNGARQGRRGAPLRVEWDFPSRDLLDPQKDGDARDQALASGRKTYTQTLQEEGRDPKAHLEELIRERELFKENGITFSWFADMPETVPPEEPKPVSGKGDPDDPTADDDISEDDEEMPAPARAREGRIFNMAKPLPLRGEVTPPVGASWYRVEARAGRTGEADIHLHADIGMWGITSADFTRDFRALGPVSHINLHINSMGGDVFDGLAIYNLLNGEKGKGARVTTYVDGIAASIASIIAMAGDEILMPESAFLMVHDPSGVAVGKAEEMDAMAATMRDIKESLIRIYAKRTKREPDEIRELMAKETWMDGPRALAEGFASRLLDVESSIAACGRSDYVHNFGRVPERVRNALTTKDETTMSENAAADDTQAASRGEGTDSGENREVNVNDIIDRIAPQSPGPQVHSRGDHPGSWQAPRASGDDLLPDPVAQEENRQLARQRQYVSAVNKALDAGRGLLLPDGTNLLDDAQQMITAGLDPKDIPDALIKVFSRKQQQVAALGRISPSNSGARITHDYTDPCVIREQMSDAIAYPMLKALDPSHQLPNNGARKFLNYTATDLMRECVRNMFPREDPRSMTRSRITDEALGNTTSDFPNILGTSANKVFLGSYAVAETTFRMVAAQRNLPNFQPAYMIRSGDFPTIEALNEHGEITRGSMSESAEIAQLKSHGRTIGVTRQVLINDNLGAFTDMAAQAGRAVAVYENALVWAVVNANPTLTTPNAAMFSTTNANLTASGTAISATSLGVGRAMMRVQKSLDGRVMNVAPRILAVTAAKETLAEQILSPLYMPTSAADVTTQSFRSLNLVVEPLLDANSTTAWYLFGNPAAGANLVYGYLSGNEGPRVRTNSPFNVDGLEFQVLIDFYAAAIDFRFGYKNVGA